jgi:hypothetical protein
MQSTRCGAGTPTPQAFQVLGAESSRAQPSQGREPTQTIEITGMLNHLHIFSTNNTFGPGKQILQSRACLNHALLTSLTLN